MMKNYNIIKDKENTFSFAHVPLNLRLGSTEALDDLIKKKLSMTLNKKKE